MLDFISNYFIYSLVIIAIFVLFSGGIYLILRPLVLWYFKIYTIESELLMNNALLKAILDELRKRDAPTQSSQQPQEDYSRYMPK